MADASTVRAQLRAGGYSPIPVHGKVPALKAWQTHTETNAEEIALWRKLYPDAVNTGILTRTTPTIDIDIMLEEAAEAVEALARERFEPRGDIITRFGKAPKRAILLRTKVPFPKITRNVIAPNGSPEKIEILCDGQQVVVFGVHPDTRRDYLWHGGEPGAVQWVDLPEVTHEELVTFADDAVALLVRDHGYKAVADDRPKAAPRGNGATPHHSPDDWGVLIGKILGGHDLHDSLRDLAAKLVFAGIGGGAAVNFLRGVFQHSVRSSDNERWADIPRAVTSAQLKYGERPAGAPPADAVRLSALDREPEGGMSKATFTVDNLMPRVGIGILSGWPGTGKTHVVNDLMCSVATGMPFAGHEVTRVCGAVLFAAEGAGTAHTRWKVLRVAKTAPHFESVGLAPDTAFPVDYTDNVPYLNAEDAFEQYDRVLVEVTKVQAERMAGAGQDYDGLGLVAIDTYNAALTFRDEQHNAVGPNQSIFNMLRRLADKHDCFILVVDHLGKDQSKGPLGTIAKTAACDLDLRITGTVSDEGAVSHTAMSVHKLRQGAQGQRLPFALKAVRVSMIEEGMTVRWDALGDGMSVPAQNKRHTLLMRAIDAALIEASEWVRMGENSNFKATDSDRIFGQFELSYPATAHGGKKRAEAIRKAYERATKDSLLTGLIGQKTKADKSVIMWRTDHKHPDSSRYEEVSGL